ncbi:MAG: YggS family pyridoxal phosphate-dependent enzyme [Candidatus Omnitrophica bacterium]|nr:YggS family pyridoxal phosphate-dependent enzyme [Candidatus Omnitrophota bacterium]MBU4473576.1 YggS family pyridoxal phosphate-dependent enzyme [Candidatus Omnitrophota bacterium]MCG2706293.1 YggS family pyridoxal phosphate-dependent enzyme [Candidatus Omnitrophota bacterium]
MIRDNVLKVRGHIPNSVTIVAVSKARTPEQIKEAIAAGITDIGENRVQEAVVKYNELITHNSKLQTIKWHMVGHLQTNKVKEVVRIFDLIQSVDSLRLASEIDKQAARIDKTQDILLQVNTSAESNKSGLKPEEAVEVIKKIVEFKNVNVKGLMTIAPIVDDPQKARPYFRLLRKLRDKINNLQLTTYNLQLLSMGMTDDFGVAIEEGSNMVRLGRAIFES